MVYPGAVDPGDLGCASAVELDRLDPVALDDTRLVAAFTSAAGLKNDALAPWRLAAELLERKPMHLSRLTLRKWLLRSSVRQMRATISSGQ